MTSHGIRFQLTEHDPSTRCTGFWANSRKSADFRRAQVLLLERWQRNLMATETLRACENWRPKVRACFPRIFDREFPRTKKRIIRLVCPWDPKLVSLLHNKMDELWTQYRPLVEPFLDANFSIAVRNGAAHWVHRLRSNNCRVLAG